MWQILWRVETESGRILLTEDFSHKNLNYSHHEWGHGTRASSWVFKYPHSKDSFAHKVAMKDELEEVVWVPISEVGKNLTFGCFSISFLAPKRFQLFSSPRHQSPQLLNLQWHTYSIIVTTWHQENVHMPNWRAFKLENLRKGFFWLPYIVTKAVVHLTGSHPLRAQPL